MMAESLPDIVYLFINSKALSNDNEVILNILRRQSPLYQNSIMKTLIF